MSVNLMVLASKSPSTRASLTRSVRTQAGGAAGLAAIGADGEHAQQTRGAGMAARADKVLSGIPKRSMWSGWLTPLPGRLYHTPNLR